MRMRMRMRMRTRMRGRSRGAGRRSAWASRGSVLRLPGSAWPVPVGPDRLTGRPCGFRGRAGHVRFLRQYAGRLPEYRARAGSADA
ncbi:hypothetical protein JCM13580A_25170 [Streptomyces drozdowiczii]